MMSSKYGETLHPILVKQYQVDDIERLLLSPRSYRDGDTFECCSACFSSLKPSQAKDNKKPPKHAIANGFAIGHIPEVIIIEGEDSPRHVGLTNKKISETMCAALSRQYPDGFVFAFTRGAQQSIMGHYHFFEIDQSHVGAVINHYQKTGANDHILCALCGRMTPNQKEIACKQARLDTKQYIDTLT